MASKGDNQQDDNGAAPAQTSLESLGITVGPTDDGKGVAVLSVDPDSAAAEAGIKEGDKIAAVNNKDVASAKEITGQLNAAKKEGRSKALFQVETDSGSRFVALPTSKG
jgi:serine protease Do